MVWQTLQPFVNWLGGTPLGMWLGQSTGRIAVLFVLHLFGLTVLLGTTIILCLRLVRLGFQSQPIAQLTREVARWRSAGLVLMLLSGGLIFTGGAVNYYEGAWFRRKMIILGIALIFNFTVFRKVSRADEGRFGPLLNGITGIVALILWLGVGVAGRAIAFF